jgi:hypothetical protein
MNDSERFEQILGELRGLLVALRLTGVDVMLVGGQVISLEALARGGDGIIEVKTDTGIVARRGFSMEPDLLFDVDGAGARPDCILDVLKQCGFNRVRSFRWRKALPEAGDMLVDLFVPPDADEANNPGSFTSLPAGDLAFARAKSLRVSVPSGTLEIKVPDPIGFLAMKLEAKMRLRPNETKDSFDLYAYVVLKEVETVRQALLDSDDGPRLAAGLRHLFGDVSGSGVADVVAAAGALSDDERGLLARAVVDTFEALLCGL